jgi:hypothetical protein
MTVSRQQRKQLRKFDREITLLDKLILFAYTSDRKATLIEQRKALDVKRWELRLRMIALPWQNAQGQR